jgi:hypothetical protein
MHHPANISGHEQRSTRQTVRNVRFQQDGAMIHMARQSMTFLRECFDDLATFFDHHVPRTSQSLAFSVGYLKSKVHATRPHSNQGMKDRFTEEME